jgi:hypothetical protein
MPPSKGMDYCLQQAQGGLCRACPTIQTVILLAMGDFFADPIVQMRIGALTD